MPAFIPFGTRRVRMTKESNGSWVGPVNEPGLLLVLSEQERGVQAALEDRKTGFRLAGDVKTAPGAAAANLNSLVKRVCRASGLRVL